MVVKVASEYRYWFLTIWVLVEQGEEVVVS